MMKKFIFILFIVSLLSCNKEETDVLTNTTWSNDEITLSFHENEKVSQYLNNTLDWVGVYHFYGNDYVLIYKPVPGKDNWPLEYTGIVSGDELILNDTIKLKLNR